MKNLSIVLILILAVYAHALAQDMPDVALVKQGNAFYSQGRLDEAVVCYRKAITENPSNFFAYMNCGYAYAAKADNKTALLYLEKAYSLQPESELKQGIERLKDLEKNGLFKSNNPVKLSKKIGLNISSINTSAAVNFFPKTGLNTGLEAIYGFGELFSVQAGLFYTQKGAKIQSDALNVSEQYINLDYIELPVAVKFSITPIKELMTGVYFGGSVAVKTAAKMKTNGTVTEQSSMYELFDYGLLGGIEATYPVLGLFWITADFRFSQGLANVYRSPSTSYTNPVFTMFFGLVF